MRELELAEALGQHREEDIGGKGNSSSEFGLRPGSGWLPALGAGSFERKKCYLKVNPPPEGWLPSEVPRKPQPSGGTRKEERDPAPAQNVLRKPAGVSLWTGPYCVVQADLELKVILLS